MKPAGKCELNPWENLYLSAAFRCNYTAKSGKSKIFSGFQIFGVGWRHCPGGADVAILRSGFCSLIIN